MPSGNILLVERRSTSRISGGYRYNDAVTRDFRTRGLGDLAVIDAAEHLLHLPSQTLLIDSLLLGEPLPESVSKALKARGCRLFVLGHFFPPASPTISRTEKRNWLSSTATWIRSARGVALTGYATLPDWQTHFPDQRFGVAPPAIVHRRRSEAPRGSHKRLITLGAITPGKLPLELLRTTLSTIGRLDCTWEIVGSHTADHAHAQRVQSLLRDEDKQGKVKLSEAIAPAKTRGKLAGADLYLATSQFESFAMATAEALAVGLPTVSFTVGDVARWLPADQDHDLIEVGDFETFARRVRQLVSLPRAQLQPGGPPSLPNTRWRDVGQQLLDFCGLTLSS